MNVATVDFETASRGSSVAPYRPSTADIAGFVPRHVDEEVKPGKSWHTAKTLALFAALHILPLAYCVHRFNEAKRTRLENGIACLPNN